MKNASAAARASRKTLRLCLLGLAAFLLAEGLLLGRFVRTDTRPPSWDQATHLEIALDYHKALGAGRWGDMWFLPPKPGMPPFPPVYQLLMSAAYGSADPAHAALWLNWCYLALLAVSLFAIAWRFMPDARALAATLAFCAAPGLQELMTTQLVDLSVVSWTAAAYWALLSSEGFTAWGPSLAFGALFAAGMLHKWSFFSYMIPAFAAAGFALRARSSRPKVLAAAALSLALFAPWYCSHLVQLPARLFQASSDAAIPFWRGEAWLAYFRQACEALGPLPWMLGFVGVLASLRARRRVKNGWVPLCWLACSYLFWTVVPNRQIRFLLPGLAPLGLFLAYAFPRPLVWSVVAVQLFGAANFFFGWAGPWAMPVPGMPRLALVSFYNRPPVREDWRIEEILRRVEADRDPARPLTNVTLVSNDRYFNAPTLHWERDRLGLPHARIRGVNSRLCELSEFVLLKDGSLGLSFVTGGLPLAAAEIKRPGGWFEAAYEVDARWPLPDGSQAVLYRQRAVRPKPFAQSRIRAARFDAGMAKLDDFRVELSGWDPARSDWRKVRAGVDLVSVRGLAVHGVKAELDCFSFVPVHGRTVRADKSLTDARLMRLDALKVVSLEVRADELKAFLESRVPGLRLDALTMDGTIKAEGRFRGASAALEAGLDLDRSARTLRVRPVSVRLMGVPIPVALFRPVKELTISLAPNPETPFAIDLPGLTIEGGRLTVP